MEEQFTHGISLAVVGSPLLEVFSLECSGLEFCVSSSGLDSMAFRDPFNSRTSLQNSMSRNLAAVGQGFAGRKWQVGKG